MFMGTSTMPGVGWGFDGAGLESSRFGSAEGGSPSGAKLQLTKSPFSKHKGIFAANIRMARQFIPSQGFGWS